MSTRQTNDTPTESIRIGPDDLRYLAVVNKRFNKRFVASPDYVRLVSSTDQVASAVEDAVRERRRLARDEWRALSRRIWIGSPKSYKKLQKILDLLIQRGYPVYNKSVIDPVWCE